MLRAITIFVISATLLCATFQDARAELLRDPTRPYTPRPPVIKSVASFSVSAVFISKDRRIAIVNGQRVTEGDQINGATVTEILPDQVLLNVHGKKVTALLQTAASQERIPER